MRMRTTVPVMLAELLERAVPPARRAASPLPPPRQTSSEIPLQRMQRMVQRLPLTESPPEPPRREPSPASEPVVEPQPVPSASSSPVTSRESEPAATRAAASTSPTAGSGAVTAPAGSACRRTFRTLVRDLRRGHHPVGASPGSLSGPRVIRPRRARLASRAPRVPSSTSSRTAVWRRCASTPRPDTLTSIAPRSRPCASGASSRPGRGRSQSPPG